MLTKIRYALAIIALGATLLVQSMAAQAAAPMQAQQAPGWFRMKLGNMEVTALNDGFIQQATSLLKNTNQEQISASLDAQFIGHSQGVTTSVNAFLINTGDHLVLVDSGAGHCFSTSLGQVENNLKASGYQPEQVDTILITHMHSDHLCGLVTANGEAVYPNAKLYIPKQDSDYWLSDEQLVSATEQSKSLFTNARKAVAPYAATGHLVEFADGSELIPGITPIATHGHTPGHTSYLVQSGAQSMIVWGDIVHNYAVQLPHPDIAIAYDVDSALAVKARTQLLPRIVKQQRWVAGAHMPFPGIGHLVSDGNTGYRWLPVQYQPVH